MSLVLPSLNDLNLGDDCREAFKTVYNNRYTWPKDFKGYKGKIVYRSSENEVSGFFSVNSDIRSEVTGITDENIKKSILSQLWEVTIHRINRNFDEVHKANTFMIGDINEYGHEVIVGGKSKGDKYRIKDGYVSMVYRHIHGQIVNIYTQRIIDTGNGYLSNHYTSEYIASQEEAIPQQKKYYDDDFVPLSDMGPWVLSSRCIKTQHEGSEATERYKFTDLTENP